jgi:hypothetical protein
MAGRRVSYSNIDQMRRAFGDEQMDLKERFPSSTPTTFSGADLQAWINDRRVTNLESITYSNSIEIVGNYGMGNRNPHSFTKGKRVIVGQMTMTVWAQHALLDEVFQARQADLTKMDLLAPDSAATRIRQGATFKVLSQNISQKRKSSTSSIPLWSEALAGRSMKTCSSSVFETLSTC